MNRRVGLTVCAVSLVLSVAPAFAQTPPTPPASAPAAPSATALTPFAQQQMENRGGAKLRVLDKITARTSTIDVKVGQSANSAGLRITLRACRENPPTEAPESAAFLEIVEMAQEGPQPAFTGWMFASSPALSSMEHAVYDVWVLNCLP